MAKTAALLLVLVVAAVAVPLQWLELERARPLYKSPSRLGGIVTFCNKSLDPLVIESLSFTPNPPVKGQTLKITVSYKLNEEVTGGNVKVEVKVDDIPLYNDNMDLCKLLGQVKVVCPVKPFSGSNSTSIPLPDIGGHIQASAEVTDQNGKELACVDIDVHL